MNTKKYSNSYYKNNGQNKDRLALGMYYRILRSYLKSGKVMEFGAGYGHLSKRLANHFESFAYDISKHARKMIRLNSPRTTVLRNTNLIQEKYFDGIICLHTLEHISNPEVTINNFARWIKKDGVVLVVMPDKAGYGYQLKKEDWFGFRDKTHVSLLTGKEWREIFERNGFYIVKSSSDWFWDPPYLKYIPNIFQKLVFLPGCLLMVTVGRLIFPEKWGEDIILLARKN